MTCCLCLHLDVLTESHSNTSSWDWLHSALDAAESSDCKHTCSVQIGKEKEDLLQLQDVLGGDFLVHGTVLHGVFAAMSLHGFCLYALRILMGAMVEFGAARNAFWLPLGFRLRGKS